jgi:hypothetical protein
LRMSWPEYPLVSKPAAISHQLDPLGLPSSLTY